MNVNSVGKKYTGADVTREAVKMLRDEMQGMKKKPLTPTETAQMEKLGKAIAMNVLKEMKVV
jgi:hypothetical protein